MAVLNTPAAPALGVACRKHTSAPRAVETARRAGVRQGVRVAGQAGPPQTRYARLGSDRLAYQVLGQGPPDLVFTMGAFSDVDVVWDDPQMALFLRRLAGFLRLIAFDRGGNG